MSSHVRNIAVGGGMARLDRPLTVVVVGGGIAGLAAATVLAERGAQVTLLERDARLGGRASSWPERLRDGTVVHMERGFHAFFRQYYNLRALLRRVDPGGDLLVPLADYPIVAAGRPAEGFAGLPTLPLLNLLGLVVRSRTVHPRDLARVNGRAALAMLRYDPVATPARYDAMTAAAYLDTLHFPDRARELLFDVFAHSFFNPPEEMSAAELLAMFHTYFLGNREGLVFDVAAEPMGLAFWEPFARHLERLGADVRLGVPAEVLARDTGGSWRVLTKDAPLRADAVVLACEVPALQALVAGSPDVAAAAPDLATAVRSLAVTAPFAVLRLWLRGRCLPTRPAFAGAAGMPLLDNIAVYDKFQGQSRRWALANDGMVVEAHAYAVDRATPADDVRNGLLADLHALYPEVAPLPVVDERFLFRQDCPAFPPGGHASRPGVASSEPTLLLAGDHVAAPVPVALMERAATTGILAANTILGPCGVRPEPVLAGPARGILASLRERHRFPHQVR